MTGIQDDGGVSMWTPRFVTASDGLRLHVRVFGKSNARLPLVCLPGLARTGADFESLAQALQSDPATARQVLAIDARGRGRSEHDSDPAKYTIVIELGDVLGVLTAFDIHRAVFLGTSRGGLLTMLMATVRPSVIAGAILNDIGPVIEQIGLMRIKGYVGKLPQPRDHTEGAEVLRRLFDGQFPKLTNADWLAAAHRMWEPQGAKGVLTPTYDVRLARTLETLEPDRPLPALWKEFDAMANVPLMVIRGATSDILSAATVAEMRVRRPDMTAIEVPDEGHTPLLADAVTISAISDFVTRCDATAS